VSAFERARGWLAGRRSGGPPPGLVPADKLAAQKQRGSEHQQASISEAERELLAERERLVERFTLMQADLGGVFYEMAIRDHVRMDVLTRKAAELQRVDAALADVERALRGEDGPITGSCTSCGAPHGGQARFCSRCGHEVAPATPQPSTNGASA
jgi:hypothetical protein